MHTYIHTCVFSLDPARARAIQILCRIDAIIVITNMMIIRVPRFIWLYLPNIRKNDPHQGQTRR